MISTDNNDGRGETDKYEPTNRRPVVYALEKAHTIGMPKGPAQTTILVLVSDPLVRAVTQEALEHEGYFVVTAGDLGGAVDWLKRFSPDLLITRIYIEHMPGHEAAKYLRTKRPGMPVLIMSGLLDDERLANRESLAGFEIFPKPYSTSQFLEKVKEVLSKSRG